MNQNNPINTTLNERAVSYGSFISNAEISQRIKKAIFYDEGCAAKLAPDQREALEVIAMKISRILNGNPDHVDSWHDIAGYATLVENRLSTGKSHKE